MILDSFSLRGKNALVTGSRTGLGAAMAIGLAQAGADVVIHGRQEAGIQEVCEVVRLAGSQVTSLLGDVSTPEFCEALVEHTIGAFGSIDILINNAGLIRRSTAAQHSWKDWEETLAANISAVFRLCQLAGRHMIALGRGKIINIASLMTFQGGILVPAYAASKGAVGQMTKALANEWAPKGVNVNAIAPGYMSTDLTQALRDDPNRYKPILDRIPAGRWGKPEDMAGAAVFLASPASDYLHGHILVVDGGWLAR